MKKYPFKFLDYYRKEDFQFYFGRESEIDSLHEMVFQTKIILVYGPSGVGKTSLLQCGLASRFESHEWMSLIIERGNNINSSFDTEITNAAPNKTPLFMDDSVVNGISEKISFLYLNSFKPIYLIFDQFEELFISGEKNEQYEFINSLKEVLSLQYPIHIIICIREDYLAHLSEMENHLPELFNKRLRVQPMDFTKVGNMLQNVTSSESSLVKIDSKDAVSICTAICEKVTDNFNTGIVQLPYLQVFLDKLYKTATKDSEQKTQFTITQKNLDITGKIGDILIDFLEDCILDLSKQCTLLNEMDIWVLLSPFATVEGTKRAVSLGELLNRFPKIAKFEVEFVVEYLLKKMVLRYKQDLELYEVVHDAIAQKIAGKRSAEEILLLELANLIKAHTAIPGESGKTLSENLLKFIDPYLKRLIDEKLVDEETLKFIESSRRNLKKLNALVDKTIVSEEISSNPKVTVFDMNIFKFHIRISKALKK